jgi:hypothetical protein
MLSFVQLRSFEICSADVGAETTVHKSRSYADGPGERCFNAIKRATTQPGKIAISAPSQYGRHRRRLTVEKLRPSHESPIVIPISPAGRTDREGATFELLSGAIRKSVEKNDRKKTSIGSGPSGKHFL